MRLLTAANLATDAVVRTLEKGDGRLGLRVLKELGCAETGSTQPVDPLELMTRDLPAEEKVEVDKEVAEVVGWLRQTNSPPKHFARIVRIGANVLYRIQIGELREADLPTGTPRFDVPKDDPRHWAANMPPLARSDYVPRCDPLI